MSLAQIGEFAFVLLSRASSIHLIEVIYSYIVPDVITS
jgi:Kef-type K+ transport system membrane component KefB